MSEHDVTVIGCGLMGSALARAFARGGYRVAAWNRTPERAEALAGDAVTPIRSVVDAVGASAVTVSCTATYSDTMSALSPVDSWDQGTLVNVTSGTPEEAEELRRWTAARGVEYLDGGLFCFPQDVGSPEAKMYFSGPAAVWSKHERMLMCLGGGARHVSEEITAANVMYVGINVFFTAAQVAYVEAATYLIGEGISASLLREISVPPVDVLRSTCDDAAGAIASGDFETDQATLATFAEGARFTLDAIQKAGAAPRVFATVVERLDAAEAAGLGHLGLPALALMSGLRPG